MSVVLSIWKCPPPPAGCIQVGSTAYCGVVVYRRGVVIMRGPKLEPPWPGCQLRVVHYAIRKRCRQPQGAVPDLGEVRYTLRLQDVTIRYFPSVTMVISRRVLTTEELEALCTSAPNNEGEPAT